uniref:Uncharacterized protein n=1 Tax=Arundo donax TaxID=35708 RepID=A0A0A9ENN6_ARUDO
MPAVKIILKVVILKTLYLHGQL